MIKNLAAILIISISLFGTAFSQSKEIRVNFSSHSAAGSEYNYSSKEAIDASKNQGFIGITAYCRQISLQGDLAFSIHTNEGWGDFQSMELYHEVELEDRTVYEGNPITSSFDSIQFRSNHTIDEEWVFRLFFPQRQVGEEIIDTRKHSTTTPCPLPSYCDRFCWGGNNCPVDSTPTPTIPTHLVVHHSAGFNTSTNFKDVVSYYWDFHVNTNGWDDIGYNWLVDPNGIIYEGRGSGVQGSHFSCMNSYTLGICMIGNFVAQAPTDTAVASLINILAYEAGSYNIDPDGMSTHTTSQLYLHNVCSHRDGNSSTAPVGCPKGTTCPGDSLYDMLPVIRQRLASKACMQGVGVNENDIETWDIYPNPANEIVEIKGTEQIQTVRIFELSGKEAIINVEHTNYGVARIRIDHLKEGVYFVKVEGGDSIEILKLMKGI